MELGRTRKKPALSTATGPRNHWGRSWSGHGAGSEHAHMTRRYNRMLRALKRHARRDGWFFCAFLFMLSRDDLDSRIPTASSS